MTHLITIQEHQQIAGKDLFLFRLQNTRGSYVEVLNWGATLVSIVVPDKKGKRENVILRYDHLSDYLSDTAYLGATIGRFANRIAKARFVLNGKTYYLDTNDGINSNHGGFDGFNRKLFQHSVDGDSLVLFTKSGDGEGGFPGNMDFTTRYTFDEQNTLRIEYRAISDRDTLFNPTNHAYFDLSAGKNDCLDQQLEVESDLYLEMDNDFLPTGNILPLRNTPFDFSDYKSFKELMPLKNEALKGYNTYFIGRCAAEGEALPLRASLRDNNSGRILQVYSNMPGVQCYTGDYLSGRHQPYSGICLEAQGYPDASTYDHFPSCILRAGQTASFYIDYRFQPL